MLFEHLIDEVKALKAKVDAIFQHLGLEEKHAQEQVQEEVAQAQAHVEATVEATVEAVEAEVK